MVFDQQGNFLRSFTRNGLVDPNCTAFFPDGSFYVSNRLGSVNDNGGSDGILGRVDKFDANDEFLFSFNAPGMASVMAVARDPNGPGDMDDTVPEWQPIKNYFARGTTQLWRFWNKYGATRNCI